MSTSGKYRGLAVIVAGVGLLTLGIALALATQPKTRGVLAKKAPKAPAPLDCKALEKQLSRCGPAIAAAFDAGLGARLAQKPPLLRAALLRTISSEFVARIAGPCYAQKGQLSQGAELGACLAQAAQQAKATPCKKAAACAGVRELASCRALATCLARKIRMLPRPSPRPRPAAGKPPAPRKK